MNRSVRTRHRVTNGTCYLYEIVTEETYKGRCEEHSPPPKKKGKK